MSRRNKVPVLTLFPCLVLAGFILLRADVRNLSGEASAFDLADIRLVRIPQRETHLNDFATTRYGEFYAVSLEKSQIEFEIYFEPRATNGAAACSSGRYWIQDANSPEELIEKFLNGEARKMPH